MKLPSSPRVVVTGAGSGLGRAFCLVLAERGARIIASDIDAASAEATVQAMRGGEGRAIVCDVADPRQVEHLADESFRFLGGVDLLINNAGVAVSGLVGEVPLADWDWILGINLKGVVHGCHFFLPRMKKQGRGAILNVASAAGLISMPRMGPYCATKAAVVALSESMRGELDGEGSALSVSVLCPTFFQTNIGKAGRGDKTLEPIMHELLASGKLSAEDVARRAIEGVEAGHLYIAPHADGRWMWRIKRAMPESFTAFAPKVANWQMKRIAAKAARK